MRKILIANMKSAYIEITNQCNLNCASCYNAISRRAALTEMSVCSLERVIENLEKIGCAKVILSGGEPTLHSQLEEIVSLIQRHKDICFGLVTNGTRLPQSVVQLLENGIPLEIQISLDGSCEEVNSRTRGSGTFAQTWDTLMKLTALSGDVRCKMVVSHLNQEDVETFYERVVSAHATPEFGFLVKQGNADLQWERLELSSPEKSGVLKRISALNSHYHLDVPLPSCTFGCPFSDYPDPSVSLSLLVKVDGTIQPCQSLYDGRYSVGNLLAFDCSVLAKGLEDFSDMVRKRQSCDFQCQSCIARSACRKGCPAAALTYSGDFMGDDGECSLRRIEALNVLFARRQEEGL